MDSNKTKKQPDCKSSTEKSMRLEERNIQSFKDSLQKRKKAAKVLETHSSLLQ